MSRAMWLLIGCVLLIGVPVAAQVYLNPVSLADVQSVGTDVGYFRKSPTVTKWNFPAGVKISGRTATIAVRAAIQDPDLGVVMSPNGVEIGTLVTRPTCSATYRGMYFTQFTANNGITDAAPSGNTDGGVKDITYQCCKTSAFSATYAWVAGYCQ